jgi:hypothetical protein
VIDNTITRMFGAKYTGDDTKTIFWKGLTDVARISTPIDLTQIENRGVIGTFTPTAFQPIGDIATNTTYSGRRPLRDTEDLANSTSLEMLKGTNLFGQQLSDRNMYMVASSKLFDLGLESRFTSPQGLKHLFDSYVANTGYFKVGGQVSKAFSTTTKEKLMQDQDLSLDRIRLIQTGKAFKYFSVDEGKNKSASNMYQQLSEDIGRGFDQKAAAIMAIEDGFLANEEMGNLKSSGQKANMKRNLNKWFSNNSRDGELTIELMKEFAPEVSKFLKVNKLKEKQEVSVARGLGALTQKDQDRLDRAGSDFKINLDEFEDEVSEVIDKAEERDEKEIENKKESRSFWENWFK